MKTKTKKIVFRVNDKLYEFIQGFSKELGFPTVSEFCRSVIIYYSMGILSGEFNKTYNELEKVFYEKFKNKENKN